MMTTSTGDNLSNLSLTGSSISTSGNSSNWNSYTITPAVNTISGLYDQYSSFVNFISLLDSILTYLTEEELDEMFSKIKTRLMDKDEYKTIIIEAIEKRHFSEEFILKFVNLADYEKPTLLRSLLKQHSADIRSGAYAQLKVYFDLSE